MPTYQAPPKNAIISPLVAIFSNNNVQQTHEYMSKHNEHGNKHNDHMSNFNERETLNWNTVAR